MAQKGNVTKGMILACSVVSLFGCSKDSNKETQESPNIIYVFPDQFRNCALNFWGEKPYNQHVNFTPDPVQTPNLDAFASESIVLTSALSNFPLSSPHRGSLLTGMYPNKSGVCLNCNSDRPISSLHKDITCISDVYNSAGYDCAYFGKLHTDFPTKNDPENPGNYVESKTPCWDAYTPIERRHGFNYWYSYGTFDQHKNPHYWDTKGKKHEPKVWSPLHESAQVIKYLKNNNGERDTKKPFFIMVGMNPPHSPYRSLNDCMEEDYNLYKDKSTKELLVRDNANPSMEKAEKAAFYFASVTGVDRAFGQLLAQLKAQGLDKNTIVVFASDHGETMCSHHTNDPKNSIYTESMNIPFIVRYPGKIKPHIDNLLLSSPDIMPTLLGLSGLEKKIPNSVQGYNYASILKDSTSSVITRPKYGLYIRNINGDINKEGKVNSYFPISRGIKTKDYSLALEIDRKTNKLTKVLFFHDSEDPYQMYNLDPKKHPNIFKELCSSMGKELKRIEDPWAKKKILNEYIPYNN